MAKRFLTALLSVSVLILLTACAAYSDKLYDVTLPYDPIDGCEWRYVMSGGGKAAVKSVKTEPHPWQDGREQVTFSFAGKSESTVDLRFSYSKDETDEERNAWRIRLIVDKTRM